MKAEALAYTPDQKTEDENEDEGRGRFGKRPEVRRGSTSTGVTGVPHQTKTGD